ncbi:hypothetical protein ACFVYR_24180 [Streptomyces sp. NPDC058284]|uniref:hypothetical protein n=1 Tax=unclassified Streptomyces TaxID=2593676 RepID=UPI003657EC87
MRLRTTVAATALAVVSVLGMASAAAAHDNPYHDGATDQTGAAIAGSNGSGLAYHHNQSWDSDR